jgi:hypothetical protein
MTTTPTAPPMSAFAATLSVPTTTDRPYQQTLDIGEVEATPESLIKFPLLIVSIFGVSRFVKDVFQTRFHPHTLLKPLTRS